MPGVEAATFDISFTGLDVLPTQPIEIIDDLPDAHPRVKSSEVFYKDIDRGISPRSHLLLFIANCLDKEG